MTDTITIRRAPIEGADAERLTTDFPVPGLGLVPINAFVLRALEPVLIDTGYLAAGDAYLRAIRDAVDLEKLRWIWLTHADADHIGCLWDVLDAAPNAKVVTTFLGLGKLGLIRPIPPQRAYLLNPGQSLDVGDRRLVAFKPPVFDAPETTGLFDAKTRTLFSSDCFGAVLEETAESANDLRPPALRNAMVTWATIDAAWLGVTDAAAYAQSLARVRDLAPRIVLSSHLPPAVEMTQVLLEHITTARTTPTFVGPDQKAMSAMLAAE